MKKRVFAYNVYLHIGCMQQGTLVPLFFTWAFSVVLGAWQTQGLLFRTFWDLFFSQSVVFSLQLGESADVKPADKKGQLAM